MTNSAPPPRPKKNILGIIGTCITLAVVMAVSKACREERSEQAQTDQANRVAAYFFTETHTLYTEIKVATSVKTHTGTVDLKPGDFLLVTARSSKFARVIVNREEVIIPLSVTDLPQ